MLPVVAEDGQSVWNALRRVLHLQLNWVLIVIHVLMILVLLDGKDAFLSVRLLRVNRKYHVVSDQGFLWLLARLIQNAQVVPDFP